MTMATTRVHTLILVHGIHIYMALLQLEMYPIEPRGMCIQLNHVASACEILLNMLIYAYAYVAYASAIQLNYVAHEYRYSIEYACMCVYIHSI